VIRLSPTAKTVKVTFALPLGQTAGDCSVVGEFKRVAARHAPDAPLHQRHPISLRDRVSRHQHLVPLFRRERHWFNDPEVVELETRLIAAGLLFASAGARP
jgi:hypothetical protein